MTKSRILTAATLAFATIPAADAAPTAHPARTAGDYMIDLVARDGDAAPVTPRLTVRRGETATYRVANDSYSLRIAARRATRGSPSIRTSPPGRRRACAPPSAT